MGEKKWRLAAGGSAPARAAAMLDAQLAACREDCSRLEQRITAEAGNHEALYRLAVLRHWLSTMHRERQHPAELITENLNRALEAITGALSIHPHNDAYWGHFAECISHAALRHPLTPVARETLARALQHPAVPPQSLITPVVSLIRSHAAFGALNDHLLAAEPTALEHASGKILLVGIGAIFQEPLLLGLLQLCIVAEPAMERLMVLARRVALRQTVQPLSVTAPLPLEILAGLAHQCFATEFFYDESDIEKADLATLQNAIDSEFAAARNPPLHWLAVSACYRPLSRLQQAGRLAVLAEGTALASVVLRQVTEPAGEDALRESIPQAAAATNEISAAVGRQYEENPYPRWIKCVRRNVAGDFAGLIRQALPQLATARDSGEAPRILIAGCGTGRHPIESVAPCRDAGILAIDPSLSSLAYAKRKTLELGVGNIAYRQCDILALDSLPERFDLIESIGVLHHLEDPLRGWRVLRKLLKPRGLMRIALYSDIARRAVVRVREQIAAQGMQPTLQDMRRCRRQIRPMLAAMGTEALDYSPDFYCVSGCRDLFFHVMEHRFTLPQIAGLLDQLDLEFLAFQLPTVALAERYRAEYRDDPAMTRLDNWHRFEVANPWIFQSMYFFWLRAKS